MPQEPRPNVLVLVDGIVVQDQMDGKISRNGTIDLFQELAEFDGSIARPAFPNRRSPGDVQGRKEAGCATACVIMGSAFGLTGQHREDWLTATRRLNLIPTLNPVVSSLVATAALFCPLAHSRIMRARKARDRELRRCAVAAGAKLSSVPG